jgi:hypothetical protein
LLHNFYANNYYIRSKNKTIGINDVRRSDC